MMRRRLPLALLSLLVVAGVGACGPAAAPQASRWSAPPTPSATPPPPLRPTPTTAAQVRTRVKAAMLDLDADFHPETADYAEESAEAVKLIAPCRDTLPSDRKRSGQRERLWRGEKVWIRQYVVGYLKVPGRKLADELRATLAKCKRYTYSSDGKVSTIVRPSPPLLPDGPETITFCERLASSRPFHQCTLLLARGNFVLEIDASDEHGDLKASQTLLTRLAPLATAALQKAT
ncbi:hypothetical protein [Micromonospora inositola]|uniref:PknH-like extracellular domain-containing protein n=1 Tax=Micromonospora inositola TaxID=47865 RepID=A0A1C5H0F2_9ACTN|nr:hypothetical protein [Micromonospora inositola]SCG39494.1 hypothetical protein GA0070613_0650 [Micromonospora inositola]